MEIYKNSKADGKCQAGGRDLRQNCDWKSQPLTTTLSFFSNLAGANCMTQVYLVAK